ncbi:MAG: hypothetical protein R6W90_00790 [Ignavibacteriaceae bacterium]
MFIAKKIKNLVVILTLITIPVIAQDTTDTAIDSIDTGKPDTTGTLPDTTNISPDTLEQGVNIQEIYQEYSEISQRLQAIQQQAISDIEVAGKTQEFTDKLESEMVKQDSSARSKMDRRNSIVDEFQQAEQEGNSDKMTKLQEEFQSLNNELQPLQQRALENNDLKEEGMALEEAVFNKMKDIDPEVPQLFARLQTLGAQLQGQKTNQSSQF